MKSDVEKLRIVAEHYFRWLRRGDIVARLDLIKILQDHCALPDFIVQRSVNDRRLIKARDVNRLGLLCRQNNSCLPGRGVGLGWIRWCWFGRRRRLGDGGRSSQSQKCEK